ncbi:MAG: prepilin-type N-terminal cleavage/methylation domain-containing protein [Betaproteobacteria bacterium]
MRTDRTARSPGFTLVEIFIAVAIAGILMAVAISRYSDYRDRLQLSQAVADIEAVSVLVSQYILDAGLPPDSLAQVGAAGKLDPWGRPYEYFNLATAKGNGKARKDKKLNPLNSDFDLYSVGKDGKSSSPLTAKGSRDDVVRALDGRFVGLASDFDP